MARRTVRETGRLAGTGGDDGLDCDTHLWRRLAMNLPCADSARAAGGAVAMPPTNPAVETQNMALRAQKPMAVAWTVVERCVELVRLYSHKREPCRPRYILSPRRISVSAAPTRPSSPHS